ncbi:MAG: Xaa-Pro peptidase family protein [Desulfuromonadaceae bacterium]|nr:Xaa-Pro peptidase family protein [Desulfuromonadaceae bacterium]
MLESRRSRLNRFFVENRLDAILITDLKNVRYLCGFSGSDGALLVMRSAVWFLCDSRYTVQAGDEVLEAEVMECSLRLDALAALTTENGIIRLGFEALHTTVNDFRKMAERLDGIELIELGPSFDEIRSCKDLAEVQSLKVVASLASLALSDVLKHVRPGTSEAFIALELELEMRHLGADGRAFDFVVASGVRGAMPHGRASEKIIQAGELITIDFGALKDGYHSDETVTVSCGEPGNREKEIHAIVKQAHDLAIKAVIPGISCKMLDAVARDFIVGHGYGDYFGHGLGHGVGLDIHEKPTVSPRSDAVLEEGMVITIEPGIYIPGFFGVRIEDTVLVTADGCQILTSADKRLLVL